jgi:hypothetical protein
MIHPDINKKQSRKTRLFLFFECSFSLITLFMDHVEHVLFRLFRFH